jgi:hypothetical protein
MTENLPARKNDHTKSSPLLFKVADKKITAAVNADAAVITKQGERINFF